MRRSPGEGTIKQRTRRGRAEFVATIPLDEWAVDNQGRRRRRFRSRVVGTRREALRALERMRGERDQGVRSERQSVGSYLRYWLTHRADVRPATSASYERTVRLHIEPAIGGLPLEGLTVRHVDELVARLQRTASLGPTSQRYAIKVLRIALAEAERLGLVPRNVATFARPPRPARTTIEPFTVEDGARLLAAAAGDRFEALWAVILSTGLRESEALGLTWRDLDLEARTLHVHHQLARSAGTFTLTAPKTASGVRELALADVAVGALRRRRTLQREEQLRARGWRNTFGLVFTSERGEPMHIRTTLSMFHALCDRAGVPRRGVKELRHTAASLLHAAGASPREIMEQLGHADVRITLQTYTHLFASGRRRNAERMDDLLGTAR